MDFVLDAPSCELEKVSEAVTEFDRESSLVSLTECVALPASAESEPVPESEPLWDNVCDMDWDCDGVADDVRDFSLLTVMLAESEFD